MVFAFSTTTQSFKTFNRSYYFVENYLSEIIVVVTGIVTWAITWGKFKDKVENLEERMNTMERSGSSYARENFGQVKQHLNFHDDKINAMVVRSARQEEIITGIFTKLEIIASWVEEQKKK